MSQFVVVPPLSRIQYLFEQLTGCKFVVETVWTVWIPVDTTLYEWLYDYIRPSHQKLLIETVDGTNTPSSLLRQLLRPHDYRIERTSYGWILKHGRKSVSPSKITVRTGIMVWSEEDTV